MLLKYLLLVSKNAISCCMFIFYPTWLLNLFTNCRTFEWMNLILNQSACLYIIHFFFLAYFRRETKILIPTLLGWELILKRSIHVTGANSGSARSSPSRRYSTISVIFWTFLGGMIDDLYQMLFFNLRWHDHVLFHCYVNMVDYIDWFSKAKFPWDAWNNWYLVMA